MVSYKALNTGMKLSSQQRVLLPPKYPKILAPQEVMIFVHSSLVNVTLWYFPISYNILAHIPVIAAVSNKGIRAPVGLIATEATILLVIISSMPYGQPLNKFIV